MTVILNSQDYLQMKISLNFNALAFASAEPFSCLRSQTVTRDYKSNHGYRAAYYHTSYFHLYLTSVYIWKHKGLKKIFDIGSKAGIQSKHADILAMLLLQLDSATIAKDMNTPGNYFHQLTGNLENYYSVKVNGNWRIIFKFEGSNAILVYYIDYH